MSLAPVHEQPQNVLPIPLLAHEPPVGLHCNTAGHRPPDIAAAAVIHAAADRLPCSLEVPGHELGGGGATWGRHILATAHAGVAGCTIRASQAAATHSDCPSAPAGIPVFPGSPNESPPAAKLASYLSGYSSSNFNMRSHGQQVRHASASSGQHRSVPLRLP